MTKTKEVKELKVSRFTRDWGKVRRELHRYPEVSGKEKETAGRIAGYLEAFLPDAMIRGIGGTGVLGIFTGKEEGPTTWFRAELDGLPLEETEREHQSERKGLSHLCGHDGHMTVLLRVAQLIRQNPLKRGRVGLLFQPAEETGAGSERVVKSSKIKKYYPDRIFALHNLPGFPKGKLIVKDGTFSSSVTSLVLRFEGRTAHAAEPDKANNPGALITDLWNKAKRWTVEDTDARNYAIVTPVHFRLGQKDYGVTPGKGEIHFTVRTHNEDKLAKVREKILSYAGQQAKAARIKLAVEELQHFPAIVNDDEVVADVRKIAKELGLKVLERDVPFSWGEDFSRYLHKWPGAFVGWGSGKDTAPLHHPEYDFPDDQIEGAAGFFHAVVKHYHE